MIAQQKAKRLLYDGFRFKSFDISLSFWYSFDSTSCRMPNNVCVCMVPCLYLIFLPYRVFFIGRCRDTENEEETANVNRVFKFFAGGFWLASCPPQLTVRAVSKAVFALKPGHRRIERMRFLPKDTASIFCEKKIM